MTPALADRPLTLSRSERLVYTGAVAHHPDCPRAQQRGCVTFAPRALLNRATCPYCLPHGVRVVED